jgi:uncharacterized protein (DUF983 family)
VEELVKQFILWIKSAIQVPVWVVLDIFIALWVMMCLYLDNQTRH